MSKPPKIHTIESLEANAEEYGDCLLWNGYMSNGVPHVHHQGGMVPVRKLLLELAGVEPRGQFTAASCGESRCICRAHTIQRTQAEQYRAMAKRSATGIGRTNRITAVKKWRREKPLKLTMEKAREIRNDPRGGPELAEEYGISRSLVSAIKRGRYWAEAGNPFAGLGARP